MSLDRISKKVKEYFKFVQDQLKQNYPKDGYNSPMEIKDKAERDNFFSQVKQLWKKKSDKKEAAQSKLDIDGPWQDKWLNKVNNYFTYNGVQYSVLTDPIKDDKNSYFKDLKDSLDKVKSEEELIKLIKKHKMKGKPLSGGYTSLV